MTYVVILKTVLDSWFELNQIKDSKGLLKEWAQQDILCMKDQSHYYWKYSISSMQNKVSCYKIKCIFNNVEINEEFAAAKSPEASTAQVTSVESQTFSAQAKNAEIDKEIAAAKSPEASTAQDTSVESQTFSVQAKNAEIDEIFEFFDKASKELVAKKEEEKRVREQKARELEMLVGEDYEMFLDIDSTNDTDEKHEPEPIDSIKDEEPSAVSSPSESPVK